MWEKNKNVASYIAKYHISAIYIAISKETFISLQVHMRSKYILEMWILDGGYDK
jgi:metal-responsive CopG/Arc/MetJ family transcriptional regulator